MPRETALFALLGLLGCAHARPGANAEMRFGAEAARRELWREARLRFERATELEPGDARAWNDLAVALEAEGRLREAFEAYRKAIEGAGAGKGGAARANLDRFLVRHRHEISDPPATSPAVEGAR